MRNPGQPLPDHAAVLATLDRSTPADPASVPPGTVVRLSGTAQPGPQGVLTAPFSGRPCVWFRALEIRHAEFGPLDWNAGYNPAPVIAKVVASDMGYGGAVNVDDESQAPITVAHSNGTVLVDPVRADVSTPLVSVDSTEGRWQFTEYVLRREWLIEAGTPVFVLGVTAVDRGEPVLRATPAECAVISAYGEGAVVERARSTLAFTNSRASGRGLLVGLAAAVTALVVVLVLVLVLR